MLEKIKKMKWRPRNIIGAVVGISFIASIIFVIIRLFIAPGTPNENMPFQKVRSDYALMLAQCVLGLFMIYFPYLLQKRWKILLPDMMYILFFIFLYCAIYLGEVRSFYYTVPHWDTILHAISAAMLATLGFNIVSLLNDSEVVRMNMSPFFVSFFAFCFAVAAGAVWEIYEFTFDGFLGFNMQKFATYDGTLLIGRSALVDTMKDIIADTLSALLISILGYGQLRVINFHGKKVKLKALQSQAEYAAASAKDINSLNNQATDDTSAK